MKHAKQVTFSRSIASLHFVIEGPESKAMHFLERELSLYPLPKSSEVDVHVSCHSELPDAPLVSNNPTEFYRYSNGFQMRFGSSAVRWTMDASPVRVWVKLPSDGHSWVAKYRDIQFSTPAEQFGQVFHELVLCTTLQLFFRDEFSLIHGSAVRNAKREVTVFGGTGGVGKTSLMLELSRAGPYEFMADDIVFLKNDGTVQCNLAFPKIYGYNTVGYPDLLHRVFHNRSRVDKLAWSMKMIRNGPSFVRRRVEPREFFDGRVADSGFLKRMILLFRCNVASLQIAEIDFQTAVQMNLDVMRAEYYDLYNQMQWASFNFYDTPSFDKCSASRLFDSWAALQSKVLANVDCMVLRVPLNMGADELKKRFASVREEIEL